MTGIAALAMYDLPEIREATDAWWSAIARAMRAEDIGGVPDTLVRDRPAHAVWRDPDLVLAQTCGYPLTHAYADTLTAIAVPTYDAAGCDPGRYRSAFVVRSDDPARDLVDLRGRHAAANEPGSQSGCNALRAALAPLARGGRFFATVTWTGAHRASIAAVRDGIADVAAIDAVTYALLRRHAPAETDGLRVLAWSAQSPALPYAARRGIDADHRARLTAALMRAMDDPSASGARATLLLVGLSPTADDAYAVMPEMRVSAERLGYPELA